jgi:hypothetical protein
MTRPSRAPGRRRFAGWLVLPLAFLAATGCGPGRGTLSGKVLYQGKPLPGGWITFRPADPAENTVHALIDENGNYESPPLPAGDVAIGVDNREWAPTHGSPISPPGGAKLPAESRPKDGGAQGGSSNKLPGSYVPIPDKYYNADTSGLHYTVKKGADTHNIELQ